MSSITLVSALFDLARREPGVGCRSAAEYLREAEFLLGLDVDLVVFTEPELAGELRARREAAGLAHRTVVVALALERTEAHRELGAIAAARAAHPVLNASPDKDTPLHAVLGWAKFELVRRAIESGPFDSTHWAWIDLALAARPDPADDVFANPRDRVTLLQMRGFQAADLDDLGAYLAQIRGHLAAGYISADRRHWLDLAARFEEEARAALRAGYAGIDEQLLPLVYRREPRLFELRLGDYEAMLANHLRLRTGGENLLFQMRSARGEGNQPHAETVAAAVLEGWRSGSLRCGGGLLAELLDECFLASWANDSADRSATRRIVAEYLEQAEHDHEFREAFLRDEVRVRGNFALLDQAGPG